MLMVFQTNCDARQAEKQSRTLSKRGCAALGEPCKTAADCCNNESDFCVGCFQRFDFIVAGFGSYRCGCYSTSNHIPEKPELGRCGGKDSRTGRCRRHYDLPLKPRA